MPLYHADDKSSFSSEEAIWTASAEQAPLHLRVDGERHNDHKKAPLPTALSQGEGLKFAERGSRPLAAHLIFQKEVGVDGDAADIYAQKAAICSGCGGSRRLKKR